MIVNNISFLQNVVYWANIFIIIGLGISFASGAMSIVSSHYLNKAKDEQFEVYKSDTNLKISTANTTAALANAEAARANEKAESEKLARLQLEARLADRKLTDEQQKQLVSFLKPFSDTEVDVVILGDTSEIRLIGMRLLECLHKANWKVHQGYGSGGGVVVKGILVGVRSNSNLLDAANALVSGLRSMGIDAGLWDFEELQYPMILMNTNLTHKAPIKIFIGSKS